MQALEQLWVPAVLEVPVVRRLAAAVPVSLLSSVLCVLCSAAVPLLPPSPWAGTQRPLPQFHTQPTSPKSSCPFSLSPINHFSPSPPCPFLSLFNPFHAGNQAAERGPAPSLTLLRVPPCSPQPIPDTSPMKRSVSTLTPQRPHAMHLYEYSLERMPPEQGHHHHHHRCHRRKEKKQKSLDRAAHHLADGQAGECFANQDFSLVLLLSSRIWGPACVEGPLHPSHVGDPLPDVLLAVAQSGESSSKDKKQERGRSQERKQHSSSSSEKQRFYSCDRYGSRDRAQPKSADQSRPTSPNGGPEHGPHRQVRRGRVGKWP